MAWSLKMLLHGHHCWPIFDPIGSLDSHNQSETINQYILRSYVKIGDSIVLFSNSSSINLTKTKHKCKDFLKKSLHYEFSKNYVGFFSSQLAFFIFAIFNSVHMPKTHILKD